MRPSSLIALLAIRYRGKATSLLSVKVTLLSKSEGHLFTFGEGKGGVMPQHFACKVIRGVAVETPISSVFDTMLIVNVLASKSERLSFDASTLASHL